MRHMYRVGRSETRSQKRSGMRRFNGRLGRYQLRWLEKQEKDLASLLGQHHLRGKCGWAKYLTEHHPLNLWLAQKSDSERALLCLAGLQHSLWLSADRSTIFTSLRSCRVLQGLCLDIIGFAPASQPLL